MKLALKGTVESFGRSPSLIELVESATGPGAASGVAVAVNGQIVRRADWARVHLVDGDEVEIVRATQGG